MNKQNSRLTRAINGLYNSLKLCLYYTAESYLASMNSNDLGLEQVVHTHQTSCLTGWPRGFGELNPSLQSRITSVSLDSGPHSNLFTSATVRIPVHTAPKSRTELIRYVTLHFRNWRNAAALRCRSHRSYV